eukprot:XP_020400307.1 uncharacterized protein LOC109942610 [Zea mays]
MAASRGCGELAGGTVRARAAPGLRAHAEATPGPGLREAAEAAQGSGRAPQAGKAGAGPPRTPSGGRRRGARHSRTMATPWPRELPRRRAKGRGGASVQGPTAPREGDGDAGGAPASCGRGREVARRLGPGRPRAGEPPWPRELSRGRWRARRAGPRPPMAEPRRDERVAPRRGETTPRSGPGMPGVAPTPTAHEGEGRGEGGGDGACHRRGSAAAAVTGEQQGIGVEQGRGEGFGRIERVTGGSRMEGGGGGRNYRALRAEKAGGGAARGRAASWAQSAGGQLGRGKAGPRRGGKKGGGREAGWAGLASWAEREKGGAARMAGPRQLGRPGRPG